MGLSNFRHQSKHEKGNSSVLSTARYCVRINVFWSSLQRTAGLVLSYHIIWAYVCGKILLFRWKEQSTRDANVMFIKGSKIIQLIIQVSFWFSDFSFFFGGGEGGGGGNKNLFIKQRSFFLLLALAAKKHRDRFVYGCCLLLF